MACLKKAKEKGLTVSFDGNFRSTLWTWEEARDYCTKCLPYVDVLFGIEPYHLWKDDADHAQGDWKDGVPLQPSYEQQDEIFQRFVERYPNIKCIARHVRYAHSGSENSLKAFMWYEDHTFESKLFTFNILDRVGGGDAFASGLIYAMLHNYKPMDMVNFAVASSAIKHTIHGDANITDDVSTIRNLMDMNYAAITAQARQAAEELLAAAHLRAGDIFVVGCSSSEIVGGHIGKDSSMEAAAAVLAGILPVLKAQGVYLAAQCCEHLNRAIVIEQEAAEKYGYEQVNAVPQPHAGGSWATNCWQAFEHPVLVEEVRAAAGIDIGGTLIGMHLKRVAVPVRLTIKQIGAAPIICARTRPKYIGGSRAVYQEM